MGRHLEEIPLMERHLQSKARIEEQAGRDILDIEPQGFGQLGVPVSNMTVGTFTGSGVAEEFTAKETGGSEGL